MNKQQLANKIWESANTMRSKIEASEYKDYILGFIFYKYLSDSEEKFLRENDFTDEDIKESVKEEDKDILEYLQQRIGYFISYNHLFSTWLKKGIDFDVADVHDALSAFSRNISGNYKKVFEGIFKTLETGLSKLGSSSKEQSKAIIDLLNLIKDIPMDGKQDYDVLGYIYEYLIEKFASNAGKKAGEFYTPHEVSLLMSEIIANHLKDSKDIKIYDPCSGSGSLLINIGKSISKHNLNKNSIKYYAQELKENTYNLTRMNLVMRGILPDNIKVRNGDTLEEDWPDFDEMNPVETYEPLYVDAVTSNPPYSQKWDSEGRDNDPRYADYGVAPKGKADYAFLLHDLYHVKPDGIMTIVLPHGVLFRGGEEGEIRKNLIEKNKIDAIIGLPANIFYGTGIPTIIMVLKHKKSNTDVLIIDASKGFIKEGKNNKLRSCDIKKISDAIKTRKNIENYCRVVSRDEIRNNDYNLNIPRYVDSSQKAESWDMYSLMFGGIPKKEIDEMEAIWNTFPSLKNNLFKNENEEYVSLKVDNIKQEVMNNEEVQFFIQTYENAFDGFEEFLTNTLIKNISSINIAKSEEIISSEIFKRLENVPLINPYEAYQYFSDEWNQISIDLEIMLTEGFESAKIVDPNLVIKKKNNKEVEVQEGWIGHVIPFEIAQDKYLIEDKNSLLKKQNRVNEIDSEIGEMIDSLTEDEKESEFFDSEGNKFIDKGIKQALKDQDLDKDTKEKLLKYNEILSEKKALNKDIKLENESLQMNTKKTIENLSDEQVNELLIEKWFKPLMRSINKLPGNLIDDLVKKLDSLSKKYDVTYAELEKEIKNTEKELLSMINNLEGNEFDMLGLEEFKELLGGK